MNSTAESLSHECLRRFALPAGLMYLAIIALGMFGELYVRGTMVVGGNSAATLQNIASNPLLWRAGIAGDLTMHLLDIPLIVFFYYLLRPVDAGLALFATFANVVQTAVLVANKLNLFVPLLVINGSYAAGAEWATIAIKLHSIGFAVGLLFFGIAEVARGILIARSRIFPRPFGLLLIGVGASYLIHGTCVVIAPGIAAAMVPGILLPAFIGELSIALWLTFKGVALDQGTGRTT